ncbi:hypothetical protein [Variovorax sp. OK605]|uniref:hypothetical protein n=1 Tax=Variovorax sp. OK605 TaxID=1855317 RepID=UPI0011606B1F|nr:hypothetical protein [Variovorax sp. OK605]
MTTAKASCVEQETQMDEHDKNLHGHGQIVVRASLFRKVTALEMRIELSQGRRFGHSGGTGKPVAKGSRFQQVAA